MKILLTGHTGFKGSWFTVLLKKYGHEIHGLSLRPDKISLYNICKLSDYLTTEKFFDLSNFDKTLKYFQFVKPDVIIHMAGQSLVSKSYFNVLNTIETNVIGTYNVLKATKIVKSAKSVLILTSDKVYAVDESMKPKIESDNLGYTDPYGTSKAAADLLSQIFLNVETDFCIGIARAGNVIGGGDFATDRLFPDIYNSMANKKSLKIRNKNAVRPWQYILDCLQGYTLAVKKLNSSKENFIVNIGPVPKNIVSVDEILKSVKKLYPKINILFDKEKRFKETDFLRLNSGYSRTFLNHQNKFNLQESISFTLEWYQKYISGEDMRTYTINQVDKFADLHHSGF
jgi:CDP-glucose 4,6-dehydratase